MSVEDLAAAVEHVLALRPIAALRDAALWLGDARATLAQIADGSAAPDLQISVAGFDQASEQAAAVQQCCEQVEALLRAYLADLGVAPVAATPPTRTPPAASEPARQPSAPRAPDRELIAEVQRQGHKISPDRVVRIARARDRRVVWLEEGDERRGQGHILSAEKIAAFEGAGISKDRIVDLIFDGLTRGTRVGFSARDRPVYEVEVEGRLCRVAITTGPNGYIVGAHPVSRRTKLRSSHERG
ncbi:hypothetical protein [Saccharomonospora halophila]|uniref:hypothetical protein n=1 Tax=Saccharomonospora halophila TaxID=129922 RepID=UPI0003670013|nr:hypothetical protein [Saccharomonospora halophila]